jgi:hypothetical protein
MQIEQLMNEKLRKEVELEEIKKKLRQLILNTKSFRISQNEKVKQ